MKKNYLFLLLGIIALMPFNGIAQRGPGWCAAESKFQEKAAQDPNLQLQRDHYNQKVREWIDTHPTGNKGTGPASYTIPIVVHIINPANSCSDIITDAQIKASVETLNEDFRRENSDTVDTRAVFKPYATDLEVEFKLAKIDPNGNCTSGITRSNSDLTYDADDAVKSVSYWNATKYFNIWVVQSIDGGFGGGITLGYAQFPSWTGFGSSLNTFGFVVIASEFSNSNSRTATHEIGHCFGLYHTHQDGCTNSCTSGGDEVCDTPQEAQATFGCPTSLNNCNDSGTGLDGGLPSNPVNPIENYMSYADCQNMFSLGQKERTDAALAGSVELKDLYTSANLIATGTDDAFVETPCANFKESNCQEILCEGSTLQFTDLSGGGTITSWLWDFGNGTTSNVQNPSNVLFATAGTYTVSLTVSDGSNPNTHTKTNFINVLPTSGGEVAPFVENFEDENFPTVSDPNKEWTVINGNNNSSWTRNTSVSSSLDASFALKLSSIGSFYEYEIISPTLDFTNADCNDMTFDYAYAQRTSLSSDELRVYSSRDCGVTWNLLLARPASTLSTVGGNLISGIFTPTDTEWKRETVSLISLVGRDHGLIKFELTTGAGNYFYLDNIDIGCKTTGIEESLSTDLSIYPNPFEEDAFIELNLSKTNTMNIQIVDVVGKVIYNKQKVFTAGKNNFALSSLMKLDNGVYFLRIGNGDDFVTRKIVKF